MAEKPERNLALELARATEAAALAAARWVGLGQKESGDQAAVNALRLILDTVRMDGVVVIGEGEKDEAPMLYNGETVGNGYGAPVDVAVDPVEGTNLLAKGLPNALSVVAIAPRDTLWNPGPAFYMDKMIVGPAVAGKVDLDAPVAETLYIVAKSKGLRIEEVTVVILERARNQNTIEQIRSAGARVRLITDGDVAPSLMAALPNSGVDIVLGIGGTPEGVITACAMHGLGGEIQGRLAPQSDYERQRVLEAGMDLERKLSHNDLAAGDDHFFAATGITQGDFLDGVRYTSNGATTQSLVTRSRSGTYRFIDAHHRLDKLARISAVAY